jgi:hypothetical protein
VERELGLSTGYLTRILAGQVELRVRHVLDICGVIGLPPERFFGALFPLQDGPESMSRLERGLAQLHAAPGRPAPAMPPLPASLEPATGQARARPVSELLRRLRQALDELEAALR